MNNSSSKFTISDLISPLKSLVSPQLFESMHKDLCMRESIFEGEKNLLHHKIKTLSHDNNLLEKQLRQVKTEYGDMILRDAELRRELDELKAAYESKTRELAELLRRETESATRLAESRIETKQLRQCSTEMKAENEELRKKAEQTASCEEVRVWREKYEEAVKTASREEAENVMLKMKNEAVVEAATNKYRRFEKRVAALERTLANLKITINSSLGEQRVTITLAKETCESGMADDNLNGLGRTQSVLKTTPGEQNSAHSMSCVNAGMLKGKTKASVSEKHYTICISDSDDEGEANGRKRKLVDADE